MSYLGNKPADSYLQLKTQQITGTGTDTYTLDYPVSSASDLRVIVNNVPQNVNSYTASNTTLTLGGTISASDECWVHFLGRSVGSIAPATGSVTGAMMSYPLTNFSSTGIDDNASSTAITIDSSGNVGIGVVPENWASNYESLQIGNSASLYGRNDSTDVLGLGSNFYYDGTNNKRLITGSAGRQYFNSGNIIFENAGSDSADTNITFTERMRIDSSGNVYIGTTTLDPVSANVTGTTIKAQGNIQASRDGGVVISGNRKGTDGAVFELRKNGTTVGEIGVWNSDNISLYGNSSHAGIGMATNSVEPIRNNAPIDDTLDLGVNSAKWDDIYATNGTIQTSDQNEKQSIQSLTSTEIAVAKRISKLFKTYKWNSAVEEKGDNARTHTGIIAQEVQQAFTDEGLDASNYALFISSTWWEKEISVDAVVEELDEEGNVLVEGKDAYTYIDTKEEATEGYTERTRLGIRYPELLSFVSSAFEQRLTDIETRIATLEGI